MSNDFFCINPVDGEAGFDALILVGEYNLKFSMLPNDDTDSPSTIIVHAGDEPEVIVMGEVPDEVHEYHASNYRLCEMAFQLNYRQTGVVCPVCEKEGLDVCGHLTFGEVVRNIFCVHSVI